MGDSAKAEKTKTKAPKKSWINGLKKIRFPEKSGKMQDHGVIAVDTEVKL